LKPVTLRIFAANANYFSEKDFEEGLAKNVKLKYPHITLERVVKSLPTALIAGETVDMYIEWHGPMGGYKQLDFFTDLIPLAKKHNIDLNRLDPSALNAVKLLSDNKSDLYGIPYTDQVHGLYYNKAIFDKFGVPYPEDGMTWDQTIELGRKLTRMEAGVQYYGFGTESYMRVLFPLSPVFIDPKTNRSELNSNPIYKRGFEVLQKLHGSQNRTTPFTDANFLKDQNVAMFASRNILFQLADSEMDWDVAQFPSYPDIPNTFGMHDLHVMMPNKHSKHLDDVMRVIEVVLGEKAQEYIVEKIGRVSILQDPKYRDLLGKGNPKLASKHISSIFKSKPAAGVSFSEYYSKSNTVINNNVKKLYNDSVDLNTFLRETEEEINRLIISETGK
jgi:ABC-type glycerol-3-phosphate transport system substrate-binding protein